MESFDSLPIERKLLRMTLLTAGSAIVLVCLSFAAYDLITFKRIISSRILAFADIVGSNSASALLFNDSRAAERNLLAMRSRVGIEAAAIYTPKGLVFAKWTRSKDLVLPAAVAVTGDQLNFSLNSFELFHPIMLDNSVVGTIYVRTVLT